MKMERSQPSVVAIECVASSSKAEEWGGGDAVLQTGDVVEEIKIGASPPVRSPFKGGKSGLMKTLHSSFKRGDTSINVKVRKLFCFCFLLVKETLMEQLITNCYSLAIL